MLTTSHKTLHSDGSSPRHCHPQVTSGGETPGGAHSQSAVCDLGGHLPALSGVGKLRGWLWQLLLMTKSMAFPGDILEGRAAGPRGRVGTGEGRGVVTLSV